MKEFNFHWLIFRYDFEKLNQIRGDFLNHDDSLTFKYACASVKTFLLHNPKREKDVILWTDDPDFLRGIFDLFCVSYKNIKIFNISSEIQEDKKHPYPWNVKSAFLRRHFLGDSIFVDNDCICKSNIDELVDSITDSTVALWEFERHISNTRPYWGWKMATDHLQRPHSYWVANDGIIGLTKKSLDSGIMEKSSIICQDVYNNVDISSKFPDRHPKLMISQQMGMCFAAQDLGLKLVESKRYFDHFYSNKTECLKFL